MKTPNRNSFSFALMLVTGAMMLVAGNAVQAAESKVLPLMQQAEADRVKLLTDVDAKSAEADKKRSAQDFAGADEILQGLLKRVGGDEAVVGTAVVNRRIELEEEIQSLRREWREAIMQRATKAAAEKRYEDAMGLASEAYSVDPSFTNTAQKFIADWRLKMNAAQYRTETDINKFDKSYQQNQISIDALFRETDTFYKNGRYNDARNRLERIFLLEPYNTRAMEYLARVYQKLYDAAYIRREADIIGQLAANSWGWIEPIFPTELGRSSTRTAEVKTISSDNIYSRMDRIIIPEFTFNNYNIRKVIALLNDMAKDADPDKRGVNISSGLDAATANQLNISMNCLQMPLSDLLRYLCLITGLKYKVEDDGINLGFSDAEMQDQVFSVRGDLIADVAGAVGAAPAAGEGGEGGGGAAAPAAGGAGGGETEMKLGKKGEGMDLKEGGMFSGEAPTATPSVTSSGLRTYFTDLGIPFPEGSAIAYDRRNTRLFVRNTPDNLRRLDEILRQMASIETPLVLIEIKMIEITENDWQELGFEWNLKLEDANNPLMDPGISDSGWSATINNPLRKSKLMTDAGNKKYTLINNLKIFPNFGNGLIKDTNIDLSLTVNAVSQNDRTEVLSAPKLTTVSGKAATIRMIKQQYFPESWEAPEISNSGNWQTVTAPVPEWGDATDIGIILKVKPEIDPDNYTISLEITPEVVSFIGRSDDNVSVTIGTYDALNAVYKPAAGYPVNYNVWMPILGRRKMNTFAKVYDGETIVLGGMIDNQTETMRDKWPVIGDLPLVGRLFASEYDIKVKRNLLIFVTTRLVNNDGVPIRRNLDRGIPDFNR